MTVKPAIPVLVPSLPSADQILPYIRRIDQSHIYSNYGPLFDEFRRALADRLVGTSGTVGATLTCNGTTAIELALRARATPGRRLCIMPSYTFIASAHAVTNAGLEPYFVEVDEGTLTLTPAIAAGAIELLTEAPAAVLVISPFGAPPQIAAWEAFEEETGIPVVFDAAAAAASMKVVGRQPQCVSLHATKVLGIGEGGAIFSIDADLIERTTAMTGFGFSGATRLSILRGGNYRISEYSAAVGLAVLANLENSVADLARLTCAYLERLKNLDLRVQNGVGTAWVTMTFNVIVPSHRVAVVKRKLDVNQVAWRHWWGLGCHTHPAFAGAAKTDLSVTDALAPRVIGVPFHTSLTPEQIDVVCNSLR